MSDDRDRCLSAGMNDYISKPFRPEDLLRKVLFWTAPEAPATINGVACAEDTTASSRDESLGDLLGLLDEVEAELPPDRQS